MALSEAQLAWLTLDLTDGMGPKRIWAALRSLRAPESIFTMSLTELEKLGLPGNSAQAVASGASRQRAEEEWMRVTEAAGQVLTPSDAIYPRRLLEIYDPPPVLRCLGELQPAESAGAGDYRDQASHALWSGMARNAFARSGGTAVDHFERHGTRRGCRGSRGALDARGKTVAVWGTGIDVIYPKENKRLAERDFGSRRSDRQRVSMGTFPAPQNFPIRNRVLSGMSVGVLVVEAGENSGTRITSRCALEQNREVFAVPGNVTNKKSWRPEYVDQTGREAGGDMGGCVGGTADDVKVRSKLEGGDSELNPARGLKHRYRPKPGSARAGAVDELPQKDEAMQLDEVMEELEPGLSSSEIFAALFELELAGRVRQMPGKNYVKCF